MIRLFVGLGNPGTEYEATRHNAGFWWVDALADRLKARLAPERAYQGLVARVTPASAPAGPVWLLEPMTYMNRSGVSVAGLARFFKIAPAEILVVHDELDLPPGEAKLKQGGSAAGHNGLKDIHAMLGTLDFWRLRIGIGHPRTLNLNQDVADFVLHEPRAEEKLAINRALDAVIEELPMILEGKIPAAQRRLHGLSG